MQKRITKAIIEALAKTPYGSTDGTPKDDKRVIARFFNPMGRGTWYVLEDSMFFKDGEPKDADHIDENMIVFAASTLGYGLELGDISLKELMDIKLPFGMYIERDSSVEPFKNTLGELRKLYHEEWD